jgi:methionyl-tRNA synthetase
MEFSAFFNQYFQHKEPWRGGTGTASCIYHSVNAAYSIAVALYPFLPGSASKIWAQLGLEGAVSDTPWNSVSKMGISPGHRLGKVSPLFAKVEQAGIERQKARLGKR